MRKDKMLLFMWSLAVLAVDQFSKALVLNFFHEGARLSVLPGLFDLVLTFNKGIAFGVLADFPEPARQIVIAAATLTALALVFYFLIKHYRTDTVAQRALAAILGGAAGNLIDRLRLGQVVDFIDIYYAQYHWPAFNLADSAICVGVVVLMLRPLKSKPNQL